MVSGLVTRIREGLEWANMEVLKAWVIYGFTGRDPDTESP